MIDNITVDQRLRILVDDTDDLLLDKTSRAPFSPNQGLTILEMGAGWTASGRRFAAYSSNCRRLLRFDVWTPRLALALPRLYRRARRLAYLPFLSESRRRAARRLLESAANDNEVLLMRARRRLSHTRTRSRLAPLQRPPRSSPSVAANRASAPGAALERREPLAPTPPHASVCSFLVFQLTFCCLFNFRNLS